MSHAGGSPRLDYEPVWFDRQRDVPCGNVQGIATLFLEQRLAEKAFASEAGTRDPCSEWRRDDLVVAVDDAYRAYGISEGRWQTEELVKRFEAAARAQAASWKGRTR
jgi:hypothetical protein